MSDPTLPREEPEVAALRRPDAPHPTGEDPGGRGRPQDSASGQPQRAQLRLAARRLLRHRAAMASLVLLVLLFLAALFADVIAPYGYDELAGPFSSPPSREHLMGTNAIGHDVLSQVLRGSQLSIQIALLVTIIATAIGVTIGTLAGYYRGWIDTVLSRLTDFVIVVPVLAVMLAAASTISGHEGNWFYVALLLSAFLWPAVAVVVRGSALSLREQDFIQSSRAIGVRDRQIITRHLLPNMIGPITVAATLMVVKAILLESSLAFLGFGVAPPDTSLGKLVAQGQSASTTRPWLFYFPGGVLLAICLAANFLGDGLRDAFDPKGSGGRS